MADSWQQIDDDGVIMDWTSPETLMLGDLLHPFRAIYRALQERVLGIGQQWTRTEFIIPGADYDFLNNDPLLFSLYSFGKNVKAIIDALILTYANHKDNSGNWDGQDNIPSWTEADILADIGDAERYGTERINGEAAKWLKQQYEIINRLRYAVTPQRGIGVTFDYDIVTKPKTAYQYVFGVGWVALGLPHTRYIQQWRTNADGKVFNVVSQRVVPKIPATIDVYTWSKKKYSTMTYAHDQGWLENKWGLVTSGAEHPADVEWLDSERGLRATYDTIPDNTGSLSGRSEGGSGPRVRTVFKYTGANGFKFRGDDW